MHPSEVKRVLSDFKLLPIQTVVWSSICSISEKANSLFLRQLFLISISHEQQTLNIGKYMSKDHITSLESEEICPRLSHWQMIFSNSPVVVPFFVRATRYCSCFRVNYTESRRFSVPPGAIAENHAVHEEALRLRHKHVDSKLFHNFPVQFRWSC